jgi:hypothetical protein
MLELPAVIEDHPNEADNEDECVEKSPESKCGSHGEDTNTPNHYIEDGEEHYNQPLRHARITA